MMHLAANVAISDFGNSKLLNVAFVTVRCFLATLAASQLAARISTLASAQTGVRT